ncbi:hypothetical protein Trydic_g6546 [Trypoxylus dichotomus]
MSQNSLHNILENIKSFVKNSEHFIEILQQHEITKEDLLVSFDVESLFTNVPVEETLEIIKQQLIPKGLQLDLVNLVRLCLTSTYFLWNGELCEQTSGAAMGFPPSPVIANIFMETFEHKAIKSGKMKPNCWYRYVYDTFAIWPHGPRTPKAFIFLEDIWFQQNAVVHTSSMSMSLLRESLLEHLISIRRDLDWSVRSPDLALCDFFVSFSKSRV